MHFIEKSLKPLTTIMSQRMDLNPAPDKRISTLISENIISKRKNSKFRSFCFGNERISSEGVIH